MKTWDKLSPYFTQWKPDFTGFVPQGAVKGVYLKGLFAQSRLFYREMDCPVRFHREMDCPVLWSLATPSALESHARANQGSVVANPICKCRRHKAGHLQVRVAVGKRSTCVLKEAPSNKGPLGFPQSLGQTRGQREEQKAYVKKVYVPFSLAKKSPKSSPELRRNLRMTKKNLGTPFLAPNAEGEKIVENRTLTDVNRRHFGICGPFSAVNRR